MKDELLGKEAFGIRIEKVLEDPGRSFVQLDDVGIAVEKSMARFKKDVEEGLFKDWMFEGIIISLVGVEDGESHLSYITAAGDVKLVLQSIIGITAIREKHYDE